VRADELAASACSSSNRSAAPRDVLVVRAPVPQRQQQPCRRVRRQAEHEHLVTPSTVRRVASLIPVREEVRSRSSIQARARRITPGSSAWRA
jgi:hypothetical protein